VKIVFSLNIKDNNNNVHVNIILDFLMTYKIMLHCFANHNAHVHIKQ